MPLSRVLGRFQAVRNNGTFVKSNLPIFPVITKMREKLRKYFNLLAIKHNSILSNPLGTLRAIIIVSEDFSGSPGKYI